LFGRVPKYVHSRSRWLHGDLVFTIILMVSLIILVVVTLIIEKLREDILELAYLIHWILVCFLLLPELFRVLYFLSQSYDSFGDLAICIEHEERDYDNNNCKADPAWYVEELIELLRYPLFEPVLLLLADGAWAGYGYHEVVFHI
jgi:hypothetical protein